MALWPDELCHPRGGLVSANDGPMPYSAPRIFVVVGGIYVTQSLIGGMTFHGIPAVLRSEGVRLDMIGLIYLFMLPWALKFLWSPVVERYRMPAGGGRRSRPIIVGGQVLAIALIASLALGHPSGMGAGLMIALALAALITATVDIACDAFAIEQTRLTKRGWAGVAQVGGGFVGLLAGGGLFLILTARIGWQWSIVAMALILLVLTLPMLLTPERWSGTATSGAAEPVAAAVRPSLRHALSRPAVRWGLVLIVVFQIGLRTVQGMTNPFLIDKGFDLAEVGWLAGAAGTVVSLAGTLIAGLALSRWRPGPLLGFVLVAEACVFALLASVALLSEPGREVLIAVMLAKALVVGAAFTTLYTAMLNWSSIRQPGVDVTVFQCADAAIAAVAGIGAGILAQNLGYEACFGLGAGVALLALLLLPVLLARIQPEPAVKPA